MRRAVLLASVAVFLTLAGLPSAQTSSEKSWDQSLRALPRSENIKRYAERLSARPHHVGSPYDKDNAEWILARFKEWGWDAAIERFDVLFPTPKERHLELVEPSKFTAKLEEPAVAGDSTSAQKNEQLPSYNAYSIDGDVTAPLVYVNYGRPEDYEQLDRFGVSVRGAIVIARYGQSWRGIKPKVAAEHGAVGCLIYSDPRDDGYSKGPVFPTGPMRPSDGVQRGSVVDIPIYPGDPLTPGVGATPGAQRIALAGAPTLTKIPVLPISYADAQPLLTALTGPIAPETWRGALPITYRLGPGTSKVHLKVAFNWDTKPLYNVIARLPGTSADEWIIRGNHHDAWVNGAVDPVSGVSVLLEEARALGELRKQGWTPKRTIVYAAWDGEEPGLLGSTEWVEAHADDLREHAVVYINTDGNGRGFLSAGGSHSLERFVNAIAKDIIDPDTGLSAWKRRQARTVVRGSPVDRKEARERTDLRIGALGSGSDYSPFLQHAGVASLNLSFDDDSEDGIYHSIYDDFYFFKRFLDADFLYGRTLAETVGTAVVRLADADVLPFEFTDLADTLQKYVKELHELLSRRQDDIRERNRQIQDGLFTALNDPRRPEVPPKIEVVPPALNFAPLENAATALTDKAQRYERAMKDARQKGALSDAITRRQVNLLLRKAEAELLDPAGLPGRAWYRHLLYAPGLYTGYGVKTIPGVRESIEQGQYDAAEHEVTRVAQAVQRLAALVDRAASGLDGTPAR